MVYELPDFLYVGVEAVEGVFLYDTNHGNSHIGEVLYRFLRYHGAADHKVGIDGENLLYVEVGDTAHALDLRYLGRIGAEVGAAHQEVFGTEGEDDLGDSRRHRDDAFGRLGDGDGGAVVVGVLEGAGLFLPMASDDDQKAGGKK